METNDKATKKINNIETNIETYKVTIKSLKIKDSCCAHFDVEFAPCDREEIAGKTLAKGRVEGSDEVVYREKLKFEEINKLLFEFLTDHFDNVFQIYIDATKNKNTEQNNADSTMNTGKEDKAKGAESLDKENKAECTENTGKENKAECTEKTGKDNKASECSLRDVELIHG